MARSRRVVASLETPLATSCQNAHMRRAQPRRVLLHLDDGRRVPLEPAEVFLLEAEGDETQIRTHGRRRLRDVRTLTQLLKRFPSGLLVQVHRSVAVNVDRISEVRRRANGRDWELRLEPPVNRVVPVARGRLPALWAAYGD
jgi:DNA-binding LytR/AlgR family response regulator